MAKYILTAGVLVALMLGFSDPAHAASVLRVPQDYPTIQAGIDAAVGGDTVLVSAGTYIERIDFGGKEITVESVAGSDATIVDGSRAGVVVRISASPGQRPVFRGFTVRNGGGAFPSGGIDVSGGPALIEENTVTGNVFCDGGGIEAAFSAATIRENVVSNNSQTCSGGVGGGGISIRGAGTVQVLNNVITDNAHSAGGGGIGLFAAGTPTISGNVIKNNVGGSQGGGISMFNFSDALITNNVIVGNRAFSKGGGISWLVPSGQRGPIVANNTIAGNEAADGTGIFADGFDVRAELVNNILVGSGSGAVLSCGAFNDLNPPVIAFNDVLNTSGGPGYGGICGDQTGLNGNISADPRFVDPSTGDFHLQPGSPAIDAGRNAGAPSIDIDGDQRPLDGNGDGVALVDMGADEISGDTAPPIVTVPADRTDEATGPAGAVVSYVASATDDVDGSIDVVCTPPSGSTFPLGTTVVTCDATDSSGNNASASFRVTVVDTTPPALSVPGDITANATSPSGATMVFAAMATDIVDGMFPAACTPPSGSIFPIGETGVTCTASDAAGNEASASFTVTVLGAVGQLGNLIALATGVGPGTSLADTLTEARNAVLAGDQPAACSTLGAFVNQVEAQSGKKLTETQAEEFVAAAERIRDVLAC